MNDQDNITRLTLNQHSIDLVKMILENNLSSEQDFRYSVYLNGLDMPMLTNAKQVEPFEKLIQTSLPRIRSLKLICYFGASKAGRVLILIDDEQDEAAQDFSIPFRSNQYLDKAKKTGDDERLEFTKLQVEHKYTLAENQRLKIELDDLKRKYQEQEETLKQLEIYCQKLEAKLDRQEHEKPSGLEGFLGGLEKVAPGIVGTTIASITGMNTPSPTLSGTPKNTDPDTVSSAEPITNTESTKPPSSATNPSEGDQVMQYLRENFTSNEVSTVLSMIGSLAHCKESLPTLFLMIHEQASRNIAMGSSMKDQT